MFLMKRFLVCVEYNGSNYFGWQKQNDKHTIQLVIEKTLSIIANHDINIFCASRTDKGVHSLGQIFHFDSYSNRTLYEWLSGGNSLLPKDITFKWINYINNTFHARFNAIARRYIYVVSYSKIRSSFLNKLVMYYPYKLNVSIMLEGAKFLLGEHNFSFFTTSKNQSKNTIKKVYYIRIYQKNLYTFFDIKANSFLYHMVRNIVSVLLLLGIKRYSVSYIKNLIKLKDKSRLNINLIEPDGLYLHTVYYKFS